MKRMERKIINALKKRPLKTTDIAKRYGMTEPTARRHCENLERRNLVICDKGNRPYVWAVNLHDPFFRGRGETVKLKFKEAQEINQDPKTSALHSFIKCQCGHGVFITSIWNSHCQVCKRNLRLVVYVEAWDE